MVATYIQVKETSGDADMIAEPSYFNFLMEHRCRLRRRAAPFAQTFAVMPELDDAVRRRRSPPRQWAGPSRVMRDDRRA
jgi:hypothetical protein